MTEKIPLYPPVPDHYASEAPPRWQAIVILSIGILSAFATGMGLVWLWGRFVVACQ